MENPYSSPHADAPIDGALEFTGRWVPHIGMLAVAMIIVGVMEAVLGLLVTLFGVMLSTAIASGAAGAPTGAMWMGAAIYLFGGLVLLLAGVLRLWAGVRNLKYRGRVLGIVALCCGFVSSISLICAPFSIGLLIYGMIVYLDADVTQAFEMARAGLSPAEARARLAANNDKLGAMNIDPTSTS